MSSGRAAKKCRAVVVTKDGKRYLTPWRATWHGAHSAAMRLAERKELTVKAINGMFLKPKDSEEDVLGIEIVVVTEEMKRAGNETD